MNTMSMIGLVLLILGIVLSPFTCFTSLILSVLGLVLLVIGQKEEKPTYPPQPYQQPYQQPYPQQPYPQQQYQQQPPQPKRMCPSCGREIPFHAKACQYCGKSFT